MTHNKIILHYCIIKLGKDKSFFRWLIGCVVCILERTSFNHVWLSIHDDKGNVTCVDLSGYKNTPKEYESLKKYYANYVDKIYYIDKIEYDKAITEIIRLSNVKYSIMKFIVFSINRTFGTKFLFDSYDCISTELIARILKASNENFYPGYSQLCGLKELKTLL